jgi:hypothetical protein
LRGNLLLNNKLDEKMSGPETTKFKQKRPKKPPVVSMVAIMFGSFVASMINGLHIPGASNMIAMVGFFFLIGLFVALIIYKIRSGDKEKREGGR